ncbi:MAG TPA: ribonuclease HI family protein [Candidatus Saccharimonadales bacterium]|nr:ribonuclease HI family protein [Candidatus Saccharimonadales bacterium]
MITVFTDGGSRGNPGPAAYGVYIAEGETQLASFGKYIGTNTNNVAEYMAVVEAYNWLLSHRESLGNSSGISFFMDSQLICNQLNGLYKVKHPNMQSLYFSVRKKEQELGLKVTYTHVPREQNKKADAMVNRALDNLSFVSLQ